jgi:hypothetical protein
MVRTPDAVWGNLAVETAVTEWRGSVVRRLNIGARLAWIGNSFHFLYVDQILYVDQSPFVAPATPVRNVAETAPVERSAPIARIAAGAMTS